MRAIRHHRLTVAATGGLLVLTALAGPVQAAPPAALSASPTDSPIQLAAGDSATVTITNTDKRATSSPLTVTLATSPANAPFVIASDGCAGVVLQPGAWCAVVVGYTGPRPPSDHQAQLTVSSGKPLKATVSRVLEVGVSFADVCAARGGTASTGGTLTLLGITFRVGDRCDWSAPLATPVYNANFNALSPECRDAGSSSTAGYGAIAETGLPAIGCVIG